MDREQEFAAKRERIGSLLASEGWDGLVLRNRANIAWLGCGPADGADLATVQGGRSEIWHQSDTGVMAFVVTPDAVLLVTENIELPRLTRDEFAGLPIGVVAQPWHESDPIVAAREIVDGGTLACDAVDAPLAAAAEAAGVRLLDRREQLAALRASLLPRELDRYRWLGRQAAETMTSVCHEIRRGMAEVEVVANAHGRLRRLGIAQEVDIVCSDERLGEDRHGLYSDRRIERAAMVVFCAHKWGLVANLTRMVHLGPPPAELAERHRAVAALDRRLMEATRPGVALRDVFTGTLMPGYAALGEPEAWRDHHQGGSTGYAGRDQRVTPTTTGLVQRAQAFAWNPSLPWAKSEDTFVVGDDGPEVLTVDPAWPTYAENGRPALVELD